jgi:hypothetical protein
MNNSIKDIIKTFKNRQDEQIEESVVEEVKVEPTPIKTEVVKPIQVKKEQLIVKESKKKTGKEKPVESEKSETFSLSMPQKIQLSDEFFNNLSGQEFVYEDRRIAYIETELYEIFMSVKRKKKLKNISVLINAILNQFVEDNKDDIKQILTNSRL